MKEIKGYLRKEEISEIALDLMILQSQDITTLSKASQKLLKLNNRLCEFEDVIKKNG